ncbi:MAG TPA: ATP-binding protein, partial [Variovorax sp.]
SYLVTLDEMGEVFDDNLRQVALALATQRSSSSDSTAPTGRRPEAAPVFEEHGEFNFTTALWDRSGHLLSISGPGRSLPFNDVNGLSRVGRGEDAWHIYTIVSGERVVQAAQRGSAREALAAEAASKLLIPVITLTLLIGALMVIALRRGLQPLDAAAIDVAARSAVSLEPIDVHGVPLEIHPLIHALNGLMQRLAEAFGVQRQFVADAAHELRSPITALRLQLQLLERVRDDSQRQAAIDELKLGVERSQRLIAQLLDLSRVEPDAPAPPRQAVDLALLVQEAVVRHSPAAERKQIDLGADAASAVMVLADPLQLAILLDNLVGNAIRYTPRGGRVDVVALLREHRPTLSVRDSGPGISAAERERVFDRFYRGEAGRSNSGTSGSGLGLAIVGAIAQRHGARVALEARDAGGLDASVVFAAAMSAH